MTSGSHISSLARLSNQARDLHGTNLLRADLFRADLRRANLSRSLLEEADFSGADLKGKHFSENYTISPGLSPLGDSADLRGANLSSIKWDEEIKWPDRRMLEGAINIPEAQKKQLGL
jgi:uncharacterized protein YjbI with pentapeptide repeats